mgnify:CR=1 FL=1
MMNQNEKYLVLLIDDNPINASVLEGYLASLPLEIMTARNGIEGLNMAREHLPDIILLDVFMPGLDGFEVCEQIRFNPLTNPIPVIFITASEDVDERVLKTENKPDGVIKKPINKVDLIVLMESFLRMVDQKKKMEQEVEHFKKYSQRLEQTAAKSMASLNKSEEMSMLLLAKLAEARDTDTGTHLQRISGYCKQIAITLRALSTGFQQIITDSYVDTLAAASTLHDIGKVGIPDHILNKPGRYEKHEMEQMKQHVAIGGHLLTTAISLYMEKPFLKIGREIVLYHHEHYDGSGYLEGLSGDQIPLSARIVALADVYDAMRSKRVYKNPISHQEVREYILDNRAKHFDPLVVDSFSKSENQFQEIFNQKNPALSGGTHNV